MRNRFHLTAVLIIAALATAPACCKPSVAESGEPAAAAGESPAQAPAAGDDEVVFVVAQTNDVHGYILPQNVSLAIDREGKQRYRADIGGVEWFAGYLEILRRKFDERVILVDGGDMFQGTMISNRFEGATVVSAMNHLGYLAAAVGNHEFDFGPVGVTQEGDPVGALRARGKETKFPLLVANLYDRNTGKPVDWEGFAPYVITEVGGVKVGIVGGPTVDTPTYSKKRVGDSLEFRPLADAIKQYVPQMRKEGATIIIGLIHAGGVCEEIDDPHDLSTCDPNEEMFQVAHALEPGTVDLLVGGHTHRILAHWVNGIPLIESGGTGKLFGMARLHYSPALKKVTKVELQRATGICHYHFQPQGDCVFLDELPAEDAKKTPPQFLGETVEPVRFLESLFTPEQQAVLEESRRELGPVAVRDIARVEPTDDLPMGLLLTHVLLEAYPDADIALFNESGIRATLSQGTITVEDVFQVLPFDSTAAYVRLSGRKLIDLLRLATSGAHGAPVVRGLRMSVDFKKDECIAQDWNGNGAKEKWERNLLVEARLDNGQPIDPERQYTLITTSYLAHGGSDFRHVLESLPDGSVWLPRNARPIRAEMVDWLRKHPDAKLGSEDDPYTRVPDGPVIKVQNIDHIPGSTCPQ